MSSSNNAENPNLTLLVVDDDNEVRLYIATVLRKNGYAVLEAADGDAAIKIMRERGADIAAVVSDILMPGMDGLRLAELNFEEGFRPFIVCSVVSDAASALKFLKFGVRDYVSKPVDAAQLVNTVQHAICRRKLPHIFADDETPIPGNIGLITVSARYASVMRAQSWLDLKTTGLMSPIQRKMFIGFVSEFLMNAYEHGSLAMLEEEKTELMDGGGYHDELRRRELESKARIEVAVSILGNEIAISVTDDGYGFDYKYYMRMSQNERLDRLTKPNGRGLQMAMEYFDGIAYSKGGAGVMLTKRIPRR